MDIKDLMVGDWVICNHYQNKPFTKQFGVADFAKGEHEFCEPIRLTEEILVKNGFRYTANVIGRHNCKCYELEQKGVYHMTISIYKNEITCELDKVDAMYMNVVTNYVHQLQHLLRLTGVQKEIEL